MAPAQYDRLPEDAPLPSDPTSTDAPFTDSPSNTTSYPPPPAYRQSFESDGSGSDLVYRDIAEEDPFDTEKQTFSHVRSNSFAAEDDEDVGFAMEPSRVRLTVHSIAADISSGRARSRARSLLR
jgi:hypothetical protein